VSDEPREVLQRPWRAIRIEPLTARKVLQEVEEELAVSRTGKREAAWAAAMEESTRGREEAKERNAVILETEESVRRREEAARQNDEATVTAVAAGVATTVIVSGDVQISNHEHYEHHGEQAGTRGVLQRTITTAMQVVAEAAYLNVRARRRLDGQRPGRVAIASASAFARALPAEHRGRYEEEFRAELYDLPRRQHVGHLCRLGSRVWQLWWTLRRQQRLAAAGGDT